MERDEYMCMTWSAGRLFIMAACKMLEDVIVARYGRGDDHRFEHSKLFFAIKHELIVPL